jgi:nucleoside-diphosphate-sugar epimerase
MVGKTMVKELVLDADIQFIDGQPSIFPTSFDPSRTRKELKWAPSFVLAESIQDYIDLARKKAGMTPILLK